MARESKRRGEPPAQVTPTGIDPRPRVGGYSVADILIAGTAILISCISLFIATKQSRIMERTLAASSWPLLQYSTGNTDDQNRPVINLSIVNAGVGPATVRRLRLVYNGRSYDNWFKFLQACCGYSVQSTDPTKFSAGTVLSSQIEGKVLRGGESANYLIMPLANSNKAAWTKLNQVRFGIKFDSCYCSVLGDCWQSDLTSLDQQKVQECPLPSSGSKERR